MAPRALWKGTLAVGDLVCPVALYAAASTAERVSFNIVNAGTGHRVRREYVDQDTGKPVEREDQVKGYETSKDRFVILEPDEIAAATPESDKTIGVDAFLACGDVDTLFFDRPYFLAPSSDAGEEAFALIREGMRAKKVAAIAHAVLFRRWRALVVRPHERGLVANTLNFDYEVRDADKVFGDIPAMKIKGEMLDLAKHIIGTKKGEFDPSTFDDRYDAALAELVKAKLEGRRIEKPKPEPKGKVIDLMEALRQSAKGSNDVARKPARAKKPAAQKAPSRKAG
ncbi:MAG: Ku protein [Rhizobiaceae bacterium]